MLVRPLEQQLYGERADYDGAARNDNWKHQVIFSRDVTGAEFTSCQCASRAVGASSRIPKKYGKWKPAPEAVGPASRQLQAELATAMLSLLRLAALWATGRGLRE